MKDKELIVQCVNNKKNPDLELMRVYTVRDILPDSYFYLLGRGQIALKSRFIVLEDSEEEL